MNIIFRDLGLIKYERFLEIQEKLTPLKQNIVLFATHYPVFTVGINEKEKFPNAVPVKRGGSITYFDEGTLMVYFIFSVKSPPNFFKKIRKVLDMFFKEFALPIKYDKTKPGYYIQNRKIASLGFSYTDGRSNHGISIHINPDLKTFNTIRPCNLSNIKATSLYNEGVDISIEESKNILKEIITEVFNETQSQSSGI
ncbi:lipoyl(octanoyl) transferase [Nautilia sp. PV-1]|uniref:lipoyl protein ligase domain-containing protein n=1 Tax=Nautilia sp. PV-1 TaxID=2579250 RepID=UPI000FD93C2C|nr:lipoyl(octanoyl) transferase [Nautilia sp. PV-1]AZV46460.1 lipoyl(octanoyl) transferase [Nautilia sp. PV-1]